MQTLWYSNDINVLPSVINEHSYLSLSSTEIVEAIIEGEHRIGRRKHRRTGKMQLLVFTKGYRTNGDELEIISRATEGYDISEKNYCISCFFAVPAYFFTRVE